MATRRPATSSLDPAVPRGPALGLTVAGLTIGLGLVSTPAAAQYMALTTPTPTPAAHESPKPAPTATRPADHAFNGQLPNQRTSLGRQRVVRDICIGCDR